MKDLARDGVFDHLVVDIVLPVYDPTPMPPGSGVPVKIGAMNLFDKWFSSVGVPTLNAYLFPDSNGFVYAYMKN